MRLRSLFLAGALLAALGTSVNANPTTQAAGNQAVSSTAAAQSLSDYQAIRNVLGLYLEGGRQGKSAVMKPAFHPQAVMYGDPRGAVEGGPISGLFDYIDKNPAATGLNAEIVKIEVQGPVAFARIESDNWNGARFSDMFLLVKNDGNGRS